MVCEIQLNRGEGDDGRWEAFLADHTPTELDDALKKINYEKLSEAFGELTPETMFKAVPMTMPMTYLETQDGRKMKGIARYPIDQWEAQGNPCLTKDKWVMLCLAIAQKGLDKFSGVDALMFEKLFEVSEQMSDRLNLSQK